MARTRCCRCAAMAMEARTGSSRSCRWSSTRWISPAGASRSIGARTIDGMLRIDVLTLFPEMVEHASRFGVTGRARERGLWSLGVWNPRDYAAGAYRNVDDRPYGGGPGMVMLAEPLRGALEAARAAQREAGCTSVRTIYLSP